MVCTVESDINLEGAGGEGIFLISGSLIRRRQVVDDLFNRKRDSYKASSVRPEGAAAVNIN